ncbi:aspartate carbamoyltransferase catalytic subunit [Marinicella litoralis]|uniref:Aspartate carbamoyltransferase n=1 Tax=Marinicella litoralis TaxID=644220 RepID=A0A4R6XJ64_9GAMM|nr:aspartate carbamoyltransferase catalytic subunit [Marinicella litoralis]TDR19532.1 aspartate carbamoyltransferase [Marinicella litoralis]
MNHLIDIKSLSKLEIEQLFDQANQFKHAKISATKKLHDGRSAMALFFENSTRTLTSFQLACQRLGVDITALNIAHSSTSKGETIKDTVLTLNAMQPDLLIVRHQQNHIQQEMVHWLKDSTSIINAGDGTNQHPTQGLLDLFTIHQHKKHFEPLKVCIIGDIKHSRVANSLIDGLNIMQVGAISLFAPDALIPADKTHLAAPTINQALADADVVVMLRIQKERFTSSDLIQFDDWHQHFGLNQQRLQLAKKEAIVMHPGPMNRGVEISASVADGHQSVILQQVSNGVLMRQALIHRILESSQ